MTAATLTIPDLSDRLAVRLRRDGGFTVRPTNGTPVVSGYALSIYPHAERIIGGYADAEEIRTYVFDFAALLLTEGNVLGGWYNAADGHTYLDVSHVMHDRGDALAAAEGARQLAIYDLSNGVEIRTSVDPTTLVMPVAA